MRLIRLIIVLVFFFALAKPALAVTETDGDLEVTYDSPLFGPEIVWYPGASITRSFTVKNNGVSSHTTYIKALDAIENGNLSTVMFFRVSEEGTDRYGGSNSKTMHNFWDEGEASLSDIGAGNITVYDVIITFWSGAGNEFQEKQARFDLAVGFKGTGNEIVVSAGTTGGGGEDTGGGTDGGGTTTTTTTTTTTSPPAVLGAVSPPFYTAPAAAGITTEASPAPSAEVGGVTAGQEGQVKGAAAAYPWYWLFNLLILLALSAFYYYWRRRKASSD